MLAIYGFMLYSVVSGAATGSFRANSAIDCFLETKLNQYTGQLKTILDEHGSMKDASLSSVYRSNLYPGTWTGMKAAENQIKAFNHSERSLGKMLDFAQQVILYKSEDSQLGHAFLCMIFNVGELHRVTLLKAKVKAKNRAGKKDSSPVNAFPALFTSALIREAFTCCADLLTVDEISRLLDKDMLFWPLMIGNYMAAVQFKAWPVIHLADYDWIFDTSLKNSHERIYGTLKDINVISEFNEAYLPEKFLDLYKASFALPVWKLPVYLQNCSKEAILYLLQCRNFDLFPQEMQILCQARGLNAIFDDELLRSNVHFTLSLRHWHYIYMEMEQSFCDPIDPTQMKDARDGVDSIHTAAGNYVSGSKLALILENSYLIDRLRVPNEMSELVRLEVTVMQYIIYSEYIIRFLLESINAALQTRAERMQTYLDQLQCVFAYRSQLKEEALKHKHFVKNVNLWRLFFSVPISGRLRNVLSRLGGAAEGSDGFFDSVHFVHGVSPTFWSESYDLSLLNDTALGFRIADAFRGWSRKQKIFQQPINCYFYLLLLNGECAQLDKSFPKRTSTVVLQGRTKSMHQSLIVMYSSKRCQERTPEWVKLCLLDESIVELVLDSDIIQQYSLDDNLMEQSPQHGKIILPLSFAARMYNNRAAHFIFEEAQRVSRDSIYCDSQLCYSVWGNFVAACGHYAGKYASKADANDPDNYFCSAEIIEEIHILQARIGKYLKGPLLCPGQLKALSGSNHDDPDSLLNFSPFVLNWSSLKDMDPSYVLSLNMRLDEGRFFLHTCSESMLIGFLNDRQGITNDPIHFCLSVRPEFWSSEEFQRAAWSQLVFPVFMLSSEFMEHPQLLQVATKPLLKDDHRAMEEPATFIRGLISSMLQYTTFMDYNYIAYDVWCKFCPEKRKEANEFYRNHWLVQEARGRQEFSLYVQEVISIFNVIELDDEAREALCNLKMVFESHHWASLVFPERFHYLCLLKQMIDRPEASPEFREAVRFFTMPEADKSKEKAREDYNALKTYWGFCKPGYWFNVFWKDRYYFIHKLGMDNAHLRHFAKEIAKIAKIPIFDSWVMNCALRRNAGK